MTANTMSTTTSTAAFIQWEYQSRGLVEGHGDYGRYGGGRQAKTYGYVCDADEQPESASDDCALADSETEPTVQRGHNGSRQSGKRCGEENSDENYGYGGG